MATTTNNNYLVADATIEVHLSYRGKLHPLQVPLTMTGAELIAAAKNVLFPTSSILGSGSGCDEDDTTLRLKLLYKGKRLADDDDNAVFDTASQQCKRPPKIMVLETRMADVAELNSKRSDPTIRGFDNERRRQGATRDATQWGAGRSEQDRDYKFSRIVACSWQSFGHRPHTGTPHDYEAERLLQKMATDPGVVAVLVERRLVVGTLGEMDPIDDRLMRRKQQEGGGCLLGYNTNGGTRIDIKLRNDDLVGFRPYHDLVATLLHELSHNWVGDHNLLFWTNYGQMRVEYLYAHMVRMQGVIVDGKTTSQLAGLPALQSVREMREFVLRELQSEMRQHGLTPDSIAGAIQGRCDELVAGTDVDKNRLGGGSGGAGGARGSGPPPGAVDLKERARQAAERRRAEQNERDKTGGS